MVKGEPTCRFCGAKHFGNCTADPRPASTAVATRRLDELERIIDHGRMFFAKAGEALAEIRDKEVYKEDGHKSFEAYLRKRWDWSPAYVSRLIKAAEVLTQLPMGNQLKNERQARALAPVVEAEGPEAAAEVLFSAEEIAAGKSKPVTAADIGEAIAKRLNGASDEVLAEDQLEGDPLMPMMGDADCPHLHVVCQDCGVTLEVEFEPA
jgi:hypothetical protein